jgi:hypothetical protein
MRINLSLLHCNLLIDLFHSVMEALKIVVSVNLMCLMHNLLFLSLKQSFNLNHNLVLSHNEGLELFLLGFKDLFLSLSLLHGFRDGVR